MINIPRKIHYCWFGPKPLSALNQKCIESWRRYMPDFEIKEWNEQNFKLDSEYCKASFAQGQWSRLSNYVRAWTVYEEGGIYFDTDVEVTRSFAQLLDHKCFLGFQQEEETVDWLNTAVFGATRGHSFVRECLDLTTELFAATGKFYRGPTVVTKALKNRGLREYGFQELGDVTVYPAEYFYPFPWFEKFTPECVTENTYCIHHWEGTWRNRTYEKMLLPFIKIKRMLSKIELLSVAT
jgi:mannosyltransferase OCH1-like enzyme